MFQLTGAEKNELVTNCDHLQKLKYSSQFPFVFTEQGITILDNKEVYHLGASLKDLGRKWFAFSKFDKEALKLLERLDKQVSLLPYQL